MEKLHIFGYGSLMHPRGINGRGMVRQYSEQDLRECKIVDHRRNWGAVANGRGYMGLSYVPGAVTHGVIFEMESSDFDPFSNSEGFSYREPPYILGDVTEHIVGPMIKGRVLTCINIPREPRAVALYYWRLMWKIVIPSRSADLRRNFFENGDWGAFRLEG